MFLKVLIITIILVAIIMLAMVIKLWFDPNAEFSAHSCALEEGNVDEQGACLKYQIKDLADCPEKEDNESTLKT